MEEVEWIKVKYTHSRDTSRYNIINNTDLSINNKEQDCKIGTEYVCGVFV
jgi:hypothetical protein